MPQTNFVGFDLETTGLEPFRCGITSVAYCPINQEPKGALYPSKQILKQLLDKFSYEGSTVCGWNIKFDIAFLIAAGLEHEVMQVKWLDGMLLWQHLTMEPESDKVKGKKKSYSLESAMKEFYPDFADFKEFKDFDDVGEGLLRRNKEDARYTVLLTKYFLDQLTPKQKIAALIERQCIPMVAKTVVQGLNLDPQALKILKVDLGLMKLQAESDLLQTHPEIADYDLNSPKQLADLLYNRWGIKCMKTTPKGSPSTDKEVLYELSLTDPRAAQLQAVRDCTNALSKFVESPMKSLEYNGDGKTRPDPRIFGTYTGRMTYSSKQGRGKAQVDTGIALHQWRRGAEYRSVITAPEGYTIVEHDFSGQEFRWMAVASNDPTMLSLCAPGEDAHGYMGSRVGQVDYHELLKKVHEGDPDAKSLRNLGKFANLSFQYRISAKQATVKARVNYGLDVREAFVTQMKDQYLATYSGVPAYWKSAIMRSKNCGYAETYAGRRVQLRGAWAGPGAWQSESTAINYPIQGTGADQKYLALAVMKTHMNTFGASLYFELHDGLYSIVPDDKAEAFADFFTQCLSNLPYKVAWGVDLPVQFPVDCKIGKSWGSLKSR